MSTAFCFLSRKSSFSKRKIKLCHPERKRRIFVTKVSRRQRFFVASLLRMTNRDAYILKIDFRGFLYHSEMREIFYINFYITIDIKNYISFQTAKKEHCRYLQHCLSVFFGYWREYETATAGSLSVRR